MLRAVTSVPQLGPGLRRGTGRNTRPSCIYAGMTFEGQAANISAPTE